MRIHIGPNGPSKCGATKGKCPYGGESGDENHYPDMPAAEAAFAKQMGGGIPPVTKKSGLPTAAARKKILNQAYGDSHYAEPSNVLAVLVAEQKENPRDDMRTPTPLSVSGGRYPFNGASQSIDQVSVRFVTDYAGEFKADVSAKRGQVHITNPRLELRDDEDVEFFTGISPDDVDYEEQLEETGFVPNGQGGYELRFSGDFKFDECRNGADLKARLQAMFKAAETEDHEWFRRQQRI